MAKGKGASNKFLLIIVVALGLVLFNILFFTCFPFKEGKAAFWSAYVFITLAFIIIGAYLGFTKLSKSVPLVATAPFYKLIFLYFGISFVFNLIFLIFPEIEPATWNVLPNIVILIVFVALFIFMFMAQRQVTGHTAEIDQKVSEIKVVINSVKGLVFRATDPTVKNKLTKLQDELTYSDPMGIPETAEAEADIKSQVAIIKDLMLDSADPAQIVAAVEEAIVQVKLRNDLLISLK